MSTPPDDAWVRSNPRFRRRGEFRDWGEHVVAARLDRALRAYHDEQTIVLCNPIISDGHGHQHQEVDFVVIGPHGVVVIEVKNWICSVINLTGQSGCRRDEREAKKDPREQPTQAQRQLYGFLQTKGFLQVRTNGLLLFARDDYQLKGDTESVIPVRLLTQGVNEVVNGRLAQLGHRQRQQLTADQILAIADVIWGAQPSDLVRRHFPLVVADYRIKSIIGPPSRRCFRAVPAAGSELSEEPVRLVRHEVGYVESRAEWNQRLALARRDYDALRRLAKIPGVPVPCDFFADPSDDTLFWTVYEDRPGRGFTELPLPVRLVEKKHRVRILADVATILAGCHREAVYHRALSPDCVWIDHQGAPWLLHWELSRIAGASTIGSSIGPVLAGSPYVAPEVRRDPHKASSASDAYSLGVMLTEIWSGQPLLSADPADTVARKAACTDMPAVLSRLLDRMLAESPAERKMDLEDAANQLRHSF